MNQPLRISDEHPELEESTYVGWSIFKGAPPF